MLAFCHISIAVSTHPTKEIHAFPGKGPQLSIREPRVSIGKLPEAMGIMRKLESLVEVSMIFLCLVRLFANISGEEIPTAAFHGSRYPTIYV
jgi:hypothetical protein